MVSFEMSTSLEEYPITQVTPPFLGTMPWLVLVRRGLLYDPSEAGSLLGALAEMGMGQGSWISVGKAASF